MIKKFEQFISEEYKPHKFYSPAHNDGCDRGSSCDYPFEIDDSLKNDSAIKILLTTIETRNIPTYAIKAGDDKARKEIIRTFSHHTPHSDKFAIISSEVNSENNKKTFGYDIHFYYMSESNKESMDVYRWLEDNIMRDVEKEDFEIYSSYGPLYHSLDEFEGQCMFSVRHKLKGDRNFYKDREKLYRHSVRREIDRAVDNSSDDFHYDWLDGRKKDVDRDLEKIKK